MPREQTTGAVVDLADSVRLIAERLYKLEQALFNPTTFYNPNPVFETVTIGDDGFEATILDRTVEKPTDVVAGWGSFHDNIFIDVSWTPPEAHYSSAQIELATYDDVLETYTLVAVEMAVGDTVRFNGLEANTEYAVRVNGVNSLGIFTNDAAWVHVETGQDVTIPPAVTGAVLARGATSVIVKFTPLTEAQAWDVFRGRGQYRVEIDTSLAFNTANLRTSTDASFVRAFNDINDQATYYGRIAAIDSSGNQGPWTVTTGIPAGGVNNAMIVADLSAAKITFGEMLGDRIQANSMDIGRLAAGSILASKELIIGAGGAFKIGSPPTTGMFMNSQGISLYGGGVQKVFLDAVTGNATFKGSVDASTITGSTISGNTISGGSISGTTITGGTFRTDTSGARVVIDQSAKERIRFYDSSGTLVGTLGYKSGGWGAGLYLTSDVQVVISTEAGSTGSGKLSAYQITANNMTLETLQAYSSITAPNLITTSNIDDQTVYRAEGLTGSPAITVSDLVVTGGSFTVSSGGSVGAASNITTNGKFFTNGFSEASTIPSAQLTTGGEIRRTTHANSSLRYKENVRDFDVPLDSILALRAVKYDMKKTKHNKKDPLRKDQYGFIAEEVYALPGLQRLVELEDGQPDRFDYAKLSIYLVPVIQRIVEKIGGLD